MLVRIRAVWVRETLPHPRDGDRVLLCGRRGWVSLAVPVGSGLALIFAVEAWWTGIHRGRDEEPKNLGVLYQPDDAVIIKGEI